MVIILLFILFFLSRVFFINQQGVFFDSTEYFQLFSNPDFLKAIVSGHFPPHEGYILLFWPLFQLVQYFHGDGAYIVILAQIVLSFGTIVCFYQFVTYLSDKRTAIYASIIASLLPLFWIVNVTLMMENAYAAFFFLSLLFLTRYLANKKKHNDRQLHISLLFFAVALLTQTTIILWAPLYLAIVLIKRKEVLKKVLVWLSLYVAAFSLFNIFFISWVLSMHLQTVAFFLYLSKSTEFAMLGFDIKSVLIILRNFLIPLLRNNTILITLLASVSLAIALKNNKKLFLIGFLWIIPALYTNQWWDSLLNGRHGLLAGFGMAFLVAYLLKKKPFIMSLVILYLLFVSIPTLNLLRGEIPYLQEAEFAKSLPKESLFIESHFARPQVQDAVKGKTIYINEPAWPKETLTKEINTYLAKNQPVFVSSAALSEPYGLYSGPYLHNLTLSYIHPFELEPFITNYKLQVYKVINAQDNLIIYRIVEVKKSPYPEIKNMRDHSRRIDYSDPLWRTYRLLNL